MAIKTANKRINRQATQSGSARPASKQRGGTFLGIVLGLIVGLAIAVVVALYITRAPTPFVSKVAPSDNSGELSQGDPNRPLQGKSPGTAVPQAAQSAPPNTAGGNSTDQGSGLLSAPQIVEVPGTANPSVLPGTTTPANPNTGNGAATPNTTTQNSPAKPPTTAAPAPSDANTGYFLQVGAYKTDQDAQQQRARLGLLGFESKVSQRDAGGGVVYYRVRLGPFAKFEDMNSVRQRLSDGGVDTAVIRFTKQ